MLEQINLLQQKLLYEGHKEGGRGCRKLYYERLATKTLFPETTVSSMAAEAIEIAKRCVDDPPAKVPRLDEEGKAEDEIESDSDFGTSDIDELV